jgi:hypothetical protein
MVGIRGMSDVRQPAQAVPGLGLLGLIAGLLHAAITDTGDSPRNAQ